MDKQAAERRISELRSQINRHNWLYYVEDRPEIGDADYDRLFHELVRLEEQFPELASADSPTRRVGAPPLDKFVQVRHRSPMLSLEDAFSEAEILDFDERDLLAWIEQAGFSEVHLDYKAEIIPRGWFEDWNAFLHAAGNPLDPTMAEAMAEALSSDEAERFSAHMLPLVDSRQGIQRMALSYLWATKPGEVPNPPAP